MVQWFTHVWLHNNGKQPSWMWESMVDRIEHCIWFSGWLYFIPLETPQCMQIGIFQFLVKNNLHFIINFLCHKIPIYLISTQTSNYSLFDLGNYASAKGNALVYQPKFIAFIRVLSNFWKLTLKICNHVHYVMH